MRTARLANRHISKLKAAEALQRFTKVSRGKPHVRAEDMLWLRHYDVPERGGHNYADSWTAGYREIVPDDVDAYGSAYCWEVRLTRAIRNEVDRAEAVPQLVAAEDSAVPGDELIDSGTIKEIAERRGVRKDTIWWYLTGAGRRRADRRKDQSKAVRAVRI